MVRATRNTVQRRLVGDEVKRRCDHPTAEDIYESVKKEAASLSRGTVYRNLAILAQMGEIRRIKVPEGADRFDSRTEPHYHFICRKCGRASDVEIPYMSNLDDKLRDFGMLPEGHKLVFYGVCADCAGSTDSGLSDSE